HPAVQRDFRCERANADDGYGAEHHARAGRSGDRRADRLRRDHFHLDAAVTVFRRCGVALPAGGAAPILPIHGWVSSPPGTGEGTRRERAQSKVTEFWSGYASHPTSPRRGHRRRVVTPLFAVDAVLVSAALSAGVSGVQAGAVALWAGDVVHTLVDRRLAGVDRHGQL